MSVASINNNPNIDGPCGFNPSSKEKIPGDEKRNGAPDYEYIIGFLKGQVPEELLQQFLEFVNTSHLPDKKIELPKRFEDMVLESYRAQFGSLNVDENEIIKNAYWGLIALYFVAFNTNDWKEGISPKDASNIINSQISKDYNFVFVFDPQKPDVPYLVGYCSYYNDRNKAQVNSPTALFETAKWCNEYNGKKMTIGFEPEQLEKLGVPIKYAEDWINEINKTYGDNTFKNRIDNGFNGNKGTNLISEIVLHPSYRRIDLLVVLLRRVFRDIVNADKEANESKSYLVTNKKNTIYKMLRGLGFTPGYEFIVADKELVVFLIDNEYIFKFLGDDQTSPEEVLGRLFVKSLVNYPAGAFEVVWKKVEKILNQLGIPFEKLKEIIFKEA